MDSVRRLKDAPAPSTTNKVTSPPTKMVTTDGDKYEISNETEKEASKDEGWTVVTKGFQPKIAQPTLTTTHNAFAIFTADKYPEINPPLTQPKAPATTVD